MLIIQDTLISLC